MRYSPAILLALLAVAAAGIAWYGSLLDQRAVRTIDPGERPAFPGLADRIGAATRVTIRQGEQALLIERQDNDWRLPGESGYFADRDKVRRLFLGLTWLFLVERRSDLPDHHTRFQVDDQEGIFVTVSGAADAVIARLVLGKTKSPPSAGREGRYYVRLDDAPQVWLARGTLDIGTDGGDWMDMTLPRLPPERLESVTTFPADGDGAHLVRDPDNTGGMHIDMVPAGRKPLSRAIDRLAGGLDYLSPAGVLPRAEAGFPGGDRAVFESVDGLVVTVHVAPPRTQPGEAGDDAGDGDTSIVAFDVVATDGASPEVQAERDRLSRLTRDFAYRLPSWKGKVFGLGTGQLLQEEEETTGEEASSPGGEAPFPGEAVPLPLP